MGRANEVRHVPVFQFKSKVADQEDLDSESDEWALLASLTNARQAIQ